MFDMFAAVVASTSTSRVVESQHLILKLAIMSDHYRPHREGIRRRESRSRSPRRYHESSHRTRSPHRHHHRRKRSPEDTPKGLPYNSRQLTKHDFQAFKPMFALYLDIQKGKILEDMDKTEVRGRWKSFIGKWYG